MSITLIHINFKLLVSEIYVINFNIKGTIYATKNESKIKVNATYANNQ